VLVYCGEIYIHLAERIEDGRTIGGILSRREERKDRTVMRNTRNARKREWATDELTANTGIEFFDRPLVSIRGYGAIRGSVGGTIKGVDRLRKAELCGRHGYGGASADGLHSGGERRPRRLASAPRIASR